MPIFRILNLGNEVPNLVSEFQNALVFLGLSAGEAPVSASRRIIKNNKRHRGANFLYGANFRTALIKIFFRDAKLIYFEKPNEKRLLFPWKMRKKSVKSDTKQRNCKKKKKNLATFRREKKNSSGHATLTIYG